jgi:tryptophanyl-tRNA synthetase
MTPIQSKFQTAGTSEAAVKLGLFAYPVLQAADILLYNTTHVPVGEDQVQHLEFTREIAQGLNHVLPPSSTNNPHFTVPQTILSPAKRIMSLKDPTKKMSKSDPDPNSRILITDERDAIFKKIKGAKTDSVEGVSYDRINRPGVSNLIDLMCYMDESAGLTPHEVAKDMENVSLRALKETVAERIDKGLVDIRDRYKEIVEKERRDPDYLERIEREWAVEVNRMATERMEGIREAFGFGGRVDMEE